MRTDLNSQETGEHGIPQKLWDECSPDQANQYATQIAQMDPKNREALVAALTESVEAVAKMDDESRAFYEDVPRPVGASLRASNSESGSTSIGTLLAFSHLWAVAPAN